MRWHEKEVRKRRGKRERGYDVAEQKASGRVMKFKTESSRCKFSDELALRDTKKEKSLKRIVGEV